MDEHADDLGPLIHELRRPVDVDPAAVAATKRAVAAVARGRGWRSWRRLLESRSGPFLPLRGAVVVAAAGLLLLAPVLSLERATRAPSASPATAGTRVVRFRLVAEGAHRVSVVGDFNDWDSRATPLRPAGRPGAWTAAVPIPPGRYTYAFVIDGVTWRADPAALPAPGDDFGRPGSLLLLGPSRS